MSTIEPTLIGRFVVYVCPKPVKYGFDTKDEVLKELRTRLDGLQGYKHVPFRKVVRPLYPMQLAGFAPDGLLKMVTGIATEVKKEYLAADLPSGAVLYMESVGEELYFFVMSPGNGAGLSEFRRLI